MGKTEVFQKIQRSDYKYFPEKFVERTVVYCMLELIKVFIASFYWIG